MPEHTYPTAEPVLLYVENGAGTVDVTATETDQAEVRIVGKHAEDVTVRFENGRLSVVAPKHRGFFSKDAELDMDVVVPTHSSVVVKSGSADVSVDGAIGECEVKSGSGDVSLDKLAAAVVDTGSGDVRIVEALGDLRVRSGSGDLEADVIHGEASISTGSGDIRIDHSRAPVVVKTGSGDLDIHRAEADVLMSTGSGDTRIHAAYRGRLTVKGASGDVQVGIPDGVAVWTDITTVSGSVRSGIRGAGEPEEGQPYVEVRASTVSGDVVLDRA